MAAPDIASMYLRWKGVFAMFHRGYWLVTSVYLVVDANLTPFQLVFIGTAQGIVALLVEIPAGVVADTISRKWSLVLAHLLMGSAMVTTGFVTSFPALVATQIAWGVAWTFVSGSDVAWVSDELDRPGVIGKVLAAGARWESVGAVAGMMLFGLAAWITDLPSAIVVAGIATFSQGVYVAMRFPEHHVVRAAGGRWGASFGILRGGVRLARADRQVLVIIAATFLVNGAAEAFGRLENKRLVGLGFPAEPDPIVWFTALGIASLVLGIVMLRIVEQRIDGEGAARRLYAAACVVGAIGLVLFAGAPDVITASIGVIVIRGVALTMTRSVGTIWVNRRATSDVRATVHSLVAQAEYGGEIVCGFALAIVAGRSISASLTIGASLLALTVLLVTRIRPGVAAR